MRLQGLVLVSSGKLRRSAPALIEDLRAEDGVVQEVLLGIAGFHFRAQPCRSMAALPSARDACVERSSPGPELLISITDRLLGCSLLDKLIA